MGTFCKCDFCGLRYDCIGFFPGLDFECVGFYVSPDLKDEYSVYLQQFAVENNSVKE